MWNSIVIALIGVGVALVLLIIADSFGLLEDEKNY